MQALRPLLRARAAAAAAPAARGLSAARSFSSSPSHSVARLIITGRLANEPELYTTSTGREVVRYVVGSSYGPRDNRQTSWFRVSSFEPEQRDRLLNLPKGTLVYVEGDASLRTYDDSEGKRHSALNILQRNFEVLRRPAGGESRSESYPEGSQ